MDNFIEGIIIFNKDFKILYMNNSMKTIFGTMCQDKATIINRENDTALDLSTFSITVHSLKIIPKSDDS